MLDFAFSVFFEIYVLASKSIDKKELGYLTKKTRKLDVIYTVLQWLIRVLLILTAFYQLAIRFLEPSRYCIDEVKTLDEEGQWLQWLAFGKLLKILLLCLFSLVISYGEAEDQQNSSQEEI